MSHSDLDHCINGNIKATVFMTQECLPHLKETKGTMAAFSLDIFFLFLSLLHQEHLIYCLA